MYCKVCGANIYDGADFCTNCGQRVEKAAVCLSCNAVLNPGAGFCAVCGTPVTQVAPQPKKRVKKPVKNLKKKVLISVTAVVLIVSIVLGIMYVPDIIARNRRYKTSVGRAQKGTVVTVGQDSPVAEAEGITVDFGSFAPEENVKLEINKIKGATDSEMGEALASYRITADGQEHSEFAGFVRITVPVDMTDYDDIDICATYYDDQSSKWTVLPHETFKEENKLIIYTDHFSDFSVFIISKSTTRFATAALNYKVISNFFEGQENSSVYDKLKAGEIPTDSDFITMGLGFLNFTSTAYDQKITMSTIMKNLPLSQVEAMSKTLTKIGFGLVLLKASYEYFILNSTDAAAQTLLMGLMELGLFAAAGAIGGPVAATVAFTIWTASYLMGLSSAYQRSKDIDTAIKTQEEFVDELYLYCINVRARHTEGGWYYRYNAPVMTSSNSGYISFKAGSDADWIKLFDKLYELNKDNPNAFIDAVAHAINTYHKLWSLTPVNYRGNSWRDDNDPMRYVKYPSLSKADEEIVTATIRENLRKRMAPIIADYKRKIFIKMQVEFEIALEKERDNWNRPISFEVTSDKEEKFYDLYNNAVMRFAVPEELVIHMSEEEIARYSNQWRFPKAEKEEKPRLEATCLGYFIAGMPDTLNIFTDNSSLKQNLPNRTVKFKFSMPDTVITIPDQHPPLSEVAGSYTEGSMFVEYVYVGEHFEEALARAQERADRFAKSIGCETAGEIKVTLGKELVGETIYTSMTISATDENEGYIYFSGVDLGYIDFTYDETTGGLKFDKKHVAGYMVASYLPNKEGICVNGSVRVTAPGLDMLDYHVNLRTSFVK